MALSTRIMRTRAALGTEALATLAAVEVSLERSRVSSEQIKTYRGDHFVDWQLGTFSKSSLFVEGKLVPLSIPKQNGHP